MIPIICFTHPQDTKGYSHTIVAIPNASTAKLKQIITVNNIPAYCRMRFGNAIISENDIIKTTNEELDKTITQLKLEWL